MKKNKAADGRYSKSKWLLNRFQSLSAEVQAVKWQEEAVKRHEASVMKKYDKILNKLMKMDFIVVKTKDEVRMVADMIMDKGYTGRLAFASFCSDESIDVLTEHAIKIGIQQNRIM